MMQMRDWISGAVGLVIGLLGLSHLMGWFMLDNLPTVLLTWVVAIGGMYLAVNSIVEITNSNIVGWWSFAVAGIIMLIGLFPILHGFGVGPSWFEFGWLGATAYSVLFIVEGLFLIIATFAMEL